MLYEEVRYGYGGVGRGIPEKSPIMDEPGNRDD
jgi:hypothetical protein